MIRHADALGGEARLRGAPAILTQAGVLLLFTVPASLLDAFGLGYMTPSGSALEKIHPGTDLIMLAFLWAAARGGNPIRGIADTAKRFPGASVLLAVIVVLVAYLIKVQRAPFTPVIDTFIMPAVLFTLLVDLPAPAKLTLERGLHVFLAVNAALGIVEFVTGWRLIPVEQDGVAFTAEMEWRAFGLLGHPLSSAAMAGLYTVILALGFGSGLPGWLRGPALALQIMSQAAFGGRTAMVMTALCLIVVMLMHGLAILGGRRFDRRTAIIVLFAVPLVVGAAALLAQGGFFEKMLSRFVDDNGSAKSRTIIFDIFPHLSWQELLLGPDQEHIGTILHLVGIEIGVESFWLGFIVLCGALMSFLVFVAFACFLVGVLARTDRLAIVPLAFYLVIISTSISLSAKSASLGQFITIVMIMMPRTRRPLGAVVSNPILRPA